MQINRYIMRSLKDEYFQIQGNSILVVKTKTFHEILGTILHILWWYTGDIQTQKQLDSHFANVSWDIS